MTAYSDMLARFRVRHGDKLDLSDMDGRFAQFYGTGARIGVRWHADDEGPIEYGTVSVTTGWKPCFLLMHRVGDSGSSTLLDDHVDIVSVKYPGARKYRPLTDFEFSAWGVGGRRKALAK